MHYEFDACIIKAWGTRDIFFRGLLLNGDPRSALLLIEVQRELNDFFGQMRFSVLRYPSGLAARGSWLERRTGSVLRYHHTELANIYHVQNQASLVACMYASPVDLRKRIVTTLLDGEAEVSPTESCPEFPTGFPGQAEHPGSL